MRGDKEYIHIGSFNIDSDSVVVSDPCYKLGTWCQGTISNILSGKYNAYRCVRDCGQWGKRNEALYILHEKYKFDQTKKETWYEHLFDVGVDSGQAGIFDFDFYQNDEAITESDFSNEPYYDGEEQKYKFNKNNSVEHFYHACCSHTLTEKQSGVLAKGVVVRSGYGDGCYKAFSIQDDDKKIYSIKIVFIKENEEEK